MDITADNIGIKIYNRYLFRGLSFTAHDHQMLSITGSSGCGKTTLLNVLGFLQNLSEGDILIDGKSTKRWHQKEKEKYWHDYSSFLYQDSGIIDSETVLYNVILERSSRYKSEAAMNALKEAGLSGRENDIAAILSGGEKRRLGIARTIYKKAKVIYADEPTASLDRKNRERITGLLCKQAEQGAIVFVATHDDVLAEKCDRQIRLKGWDTDAAH